MPLTVSKPTPAKMSLLADQLRDSPVTYPEIGATQNEILPDGYRHDRHSIRLGKGQRAFESARDALLRWEAHRAAGASLVPETPSLTVGTVAVITMRTGPMRVTAPCRIVYVTDDAECFGCAYGTLPGHPEQGEELFLISYDSSGEVRFEIVAFSRPADRLARIGFPVARWAQERVTKKYLEGVQNYVVAAK